MLLEKNLPSVITPVIDTVLSWKFNKPLTQSLVQVFSVGNRIGKKGHYNFLCFHKKEEEEEGGGEGRREREKEEEKK